MIESSRKLALAGAEFFICPANTNHVVFERVRDAVVIPWLHIASVVGERAANLGCKRTLLLGTRTLMQSKVYDPFFDAKGIELRLPEAAEQEEVNRMIYDELVRGKVVASSKTYVERLIDRYADQQQCDSVVLGCTELPLLVPDVKGSLSVLDSTRLVAHGAIGFSLGMSLGEVERLITNRGTTERPAAVCGIGNFRGGRSRSS